MIIEQLLWLLNVVHMNSYLFIFLLVVIEGPIVTALASYAASLGYFNIWIILLISVLGNILPDLVLYSIGRFSRDLKIEFLKKRFKLGDIQIEKLEDNLKKHSRKTLCLVKLCPMLPVPGLILSGFVRMPFKRFLLIDIIFNLVSSVLSVLIGYYFGYMVNTIFKYFKIGQYSILGILLLVIIMFFIYKKIQKKEKDKIEKKSDI